MLARPVSVSIFNRPEASVEQQVTFTNLVLALYTTININTVILKGGRGMIKKKISFKPPEMIYNNANVHALNVHVLLDCLHSNLCHSITVAEIRLK